PRSLPPPSAGRPGPEPSPTRNVGPSGPPPPGIAPMSSSKNGQSDPTDSPATPVAAPVHPDHAAPRASGHAGKDGNEGGQGGTAAVLQAVRRQWLPALILGILAGAGAAAAGWFFVPAKFTAKSTVRVEAVRPAVLFPERESGGNFVNYQRAQLA